MAARLESMCSTIPTLPCPESEGRSHRRRPTGEVRLARVARTSCGVGAGSRVRRERSGEGRGGVDTKDVDVVREPATYRGVFPSRRSQSRTA